MFKRFRSKTTGSSKKGKEENTKNADSQKKVDLPVAEKTTNADDRKETSKKDTKKQDKKSKKEPQVKQQSSKSDSTNSPQIQSKQPQVSSYTASPEQLRGDPSSNDKTATPTLYSNMDPSLLASRKFNLALERNAYLVSPTTDLKTDKETTPLSSYADVSAYTTSSRSLVNHQSKSNLASPRTSLTLEEMQRLRSGSISSSSYSHQSTNSLTQKSKPVEKQASNITTSTQPALYADVEEKETQKEESESESEEENENTSSYGQENSVNNDKKTGYTDFKEKQKETPYSEYNSEGSSKLVGVYVADDDIKKEKAASKRNMKKNKVIEIVTDPEKAKLQEIAKSITNTFEFRDEGSIDWNLAHLEATNSIMEKKSKSIKPSAIDFYQLSTVSNQFVDTAILYAKIIISEYALPAANKTIKPINIGGQAGGEKYLHQGILFKFALDTIILDDPQVWMYGGSTPDNVAAMKSAKNELKGLEAHRTTHVEGLNYPLLAVIDYKGYRLIAMSLLPINKQTIKYGSNDSGVNVHDDDDELNKLMQQAAERCNLKGHITGLRTGFKKTIYGPGDIEAHMGTDGKYYLVDFGRVLPPEDPNFRNQGSRDVFFHLLRQELVKRYNKPLTSDAFTNWNSDDDPQQRQQNNKDVTEATEHLYNYLIPRFAREIDGNTKLQNFSWEQMNHHHLKSLYETLSQIHAFGINYRHLGFIRSKVSLPNSQRLLLSTMVSRVIKDELKKNMRNKMIQSHVPSDEPFKEEAVKLLNQVLKQNAESIIFWNNIKNALKVKYITGLSAVELDSAFNLQEAVDLRFVIFHLLHTVGIKLKKAARHQLLHSADNFCFVEDDIKSIEAKTQHVSLVYFAEAMHLMEKALEAKSATNAAKQHEVTRQLETAVETFTDAHARAPVCPLIVLNYGKALSELGILRSQPDEAEPLFRKSSHYFEQSILFWPGYSPATQEWVNSLKKQADYYEIIGDKTKSESLTALADEKLNSIDPNNVSACWKVKPLQYF